MPSIKDNYSCYSQPWTDVSRSPEPIFLDLEDGKLLAVCDTSNSTLIPFAAESIFNVS